MRILYLEDNEVFAEQSARLFLPGHEVVVCTTLASAQTTISDVLDLAIVDYDLPDGKGDAFVHECRRRFPALPIIAASSHTPGNNALRSAGARAVCGKMQFNQIGAVVEKLCRVK